VGIGCSTVGTEGTRRGNGHWAYLNFLIFSCGHMNIRTGLENGAKQSLIAQFTTGSRRNDSGSDYRASVYPPSSHTPCPRRRLLLPNVGQRCRSRDRTPLRLHLVQNLLYAPNRLALDHLLHLLQVQRLVFHERTCQLLDATTSSDGDKSENQQGRGGKRLLTRWSSSSFSFSKSVARFSPAFSILEKRSQRTPDPTSHLAPRHHSQIAE